MARKRRARDREHFETAAAARRFIRATGRHVGAGDVEDLALLVGLAAAVDDAMAAAVTELHDRRDWSWAQIGRVLGITRQAAQQRYGNTRTERTQLAGQDGLF